MAAVANAKLWGIKPWGLVEGNSFWNAFLNIKSRSFIKCPACCRGQKKLLKLTLCFFFLKALKRERMRIHGSSNQYLTVVFYIKRCVSRSGCLWSLWARRITCSQVHMVIRLRIFISPNPCSDKKFSSSKSDCDKEAVEVDKDTESTKLLFWLLSIFPLLSVAFLRVSKNHQ